MHWQILNILWEEMLKLFSLTGSCRVTFVFLAPLVMCITLHLHVQIVMAGIIVQKQDDFDF